MSVEDLKWLFRLLFVRLSFFRAHLTSGQVGQALGDNSGQFGKAMGDKSGQVGHYSVSIFLCFICRGPCCSLSLL